MSILLLGVGGLSLGTIVILLLSDRTPIKAPVRARRAGKGDRPAR